MTTCKYQEQFAEELATSWIAGNRAYVRTTIRNLKNKAQAAYVAAQVALELNSDGGDGGAAFARFMHPNNL